MGAVVVLMLFGASTIQTDTVLAAATGGGAVFPARPVRIVNPYAPGGSVDIVARSVAQRLSRLWGQPVIVDNRPGAGTIIGTDLVVRAQPDGYTLLCTTGAIAINVSLHKKLPFDPVTSLAPIAMIAQAPNVLAVHPSVAARSTGDLVELAKSRPREITFASSGTGSSTHLTMELFRSMAKIEVVHIPYKGGGPAVTDLLGGQVSAIFNPPTAILPLAKTGKLRALGVTSAKRMEIAPDLPTIAESGLTGFESVVWYAVFAPAAIQPALVARINADINRIVQETEFHERSVNIGLFPVVHTPRSVGAYLRTEIDRWAAVVRESGIKAE